MSIKINQKKNQSVYCWTKPNQNRVFGNKQKHTYKTQNVFQIQYKVKRAVRVIFCTSLCDLLAKYHVEFEQYSLKLDTNFPLRWKTLPERKHRAWLSIGLKFPAKITSPAVSRQICSTRTCTQEQVRILLIHSTYFISTR